MFFETFEDREAAFNHAVGSLVPVRHKGPAVFWQDFQRIIQGRPAQDKTLPAYITSNPRDCLAFGSASQVLAAALTTVGKTGEQGRIMGHDLARQFDMQAVLDQPIRTLSGGEMVRLALAKTMIMAEACDLFVVSSPFCWMSANHLPHLVRVVDAFVNAHKRVHILAMREETSTAPMSAAHLDRLTRQRPDFTLVCQSLRIHLDTPLNAVARQPAMARVTDATYRLSSPCLVVGDNGQGKSLLAKAFCGAVAIEGRAAVGGRQHQGRARLLFQDVVTQTLMRTMPVMARYADHGAEAIFQDILHGYEQGLTACDVSGNPMLSRPADGSLIMVKMMLIAVRLARRPSALILDEPDWGLSRTSAVALVLAVVEKAHALGVAVIIISHKAWWRPMAADILAVSKEPACEPPLRFIIHMNRTASAS